MESCIPSSEIEFTPMLARVLSGSYGSGDIESYLHKGRCFLNVTVRNDFVLNLAAVLQTSQIILPSPFTSNSPDSFTFTVGKLGTLYFILTFLGFR
jgi:hypothetical protein